jgi:two-component system chemotaxis sensor kinase CheA
MVDAVTAGQRRLPLPPLPPEWGVAPIVEEPAPAAAPAPVAAPAAAPRPAPTPAADLPADEEIAVLPPDGDEELWQMFCAEAHDFLQEIEQAALVLETSPDDAERINKLFRAFHTLKGNAGLLKLTVLQRFTHELESLLDLARRGRLVLGRSAIDVVLESADVIRRFVAEMESQVAGANRGRRIALPIPRLVARAKSVIAGEPAAPAAAAVPMAAPAPAPSGPAAAPPAAVQPPAPAPAAAPAPVAVAPAPLAAAPAEPAAGAPPEPTAPATPAAPESTAAGGSLIRIDARKLDGLIDMVGELVVAQSMVVQSPDLAGVTTPHLAWCLGQLRSISGDLQRMALALRMVPIGGTFRRMTRLVRDLSGELGKEIELVIEGEGTELDRTIVEELSDPLVHMIRNSADHGLEPPAERAAAGKPRMGTITVRAFHQGGFVVIQVADDGRGLDAARIRRKAVERGLVGPDQRLTDDEAHDLIFMPGFSTAEKVTGISGRGVGMDVVRRNIERIRGKVEVAATPGRGTTFTIWVPLTLAIIEGLLVSVGDERYIVPTLSVRESFRPLPGSVTTVQGRGELVSVRGRLTPLLRLGRHLGVAARAEDPAAGIVVVIEAGQDSRCILVDELLGKQEVVIKSLGETFGRQRAFAGAAILGDGRVGLILDVNALVKLKGPAEAAA